MADLVTGLTIAAFVVIAANMVVSGLVLLEHRNGSSIIGYMLLFHLVMALFSMVAAVTLFTESFLYDRQELIIARIVAAIALALLVLVSCLNTLHIVGVIGEWPVKWLLVDTADEITLVPPAEQIREEMSKEETEV